uniref:Uncharacterized protein n=1 Tax=Rhizophora mucronata TaxID=61149 RepID=A0A2P2QY36_RHIMU
MGVLVIFNFQKVTCNLFSLAAHLTHWPY